MFIWLNRQGVQSDEGFVFQFTGRFTAEYREVDKTMDIQVEDAFAGGKPAVNVLRSSFAKWRGGGETIPDVDRDRIADNVRRAGEFQGLVVVFV